MPISKQVRQSLNKASHSFLEMIHGVGDAPKIPFIHVKNELSIIHRELLADNPPRDDESARFVLAIFEGHLNTWKSFEKLSKSHALQVSLGNYSEALKIRKSIEVFKQRISKDYGGLALLEAFKSLGKDEFDREKRDRMIRHNYEVVEQFLLPLLEKYPLAENIMERRKDKESLQSESVLSKKLKDFVCEHILAQHKLPEKDHEAVKKIILGRRNEVPDFQRVIKNKGASEALNDAYQKLVLLSGSMLIGDDERVVHLIRNHVAPLWPKIALFLRK